MFRSFFILLVSALLMLGGCGGDSSTGSVIKRTTTVTEQQALDAAKADARDRGAYADADRYSAEPLGNGWQITIMDSSGKINLIVLDAEGAVIHRDLYDG